MRHFGARLAVLLSFSMLCIANVAAADERSANFTAYLREGPGLRYRVIDEIATGQRVDVAECNDGWCRLLLDRATGFVPQGVLDATREERARAPTTCFLNRGNGSRGGMPEQFCYEPASKR